MMPSPCGPLKRARTRSNKDRRLRHGSPVHLRQNVPLLLIGDVRLCRCPLFDRLTHLRSSERGHSARVGDPAQRLLMLDIMSWHDQATLYMKEGQSPDNFCRLFCLLNVCGTHNSRPLDEPLRYNVHKGINATTDSGTSTILHVTRQPTTALAPYWCWASSHTESMRE